LSKLLVTVERYPDLKANKNFLELQSQLEGTENRIKVARDKFNDTVKGYNKTVKKFPGNLFAGVFGFKSRPYFESDKGAEKAPEVKF
jgi:LemA protein